jgi:hypothetical protein
VLTFRDDNQNNNNNNNNNNNIFWNGIEYSAFNAFNCKAVGDVRVKGLFAGSGEKVNIGVPY